MLQALLHHKLGTAISGGEYSYSEDSLNSSIFGLLQYFPDEDLWQILRNACGECKLPESIGIIESIEFWPHLNAKDTTNTNLVEPDILLESSNYIVNVEAKKYDGYEMQYYEQWENEITAIRNEYPDKEILFIAVGGNSKLATDEFSFDDKKITINKASWLNILMSVQNIHTKDNHTNRLKKDIINVFAFHGMVPMKFMDSFDDIEINDNSRKILLDSFGWVNIKK